MAKIGTATVRLGLDFFSSDLPTCAALSPQQVVAVGELMVLDVIGIRNDSQRRLPRRRRYGNWRVYFDIIWPRIRDDLIDLINLCEMKYHAGAFVITKKYANELSIKRQVFVAVTGTTKGIHQTFVTADGLYENE